MLCEEIDMKLYIIANRLPVKVADTNGTFVFSRSEGGLATGLDSLQTSYEKHWIGWPGICTNEEKDQQEINEKLQEMNFHPVFLSEKQIENYYEGYSNSTIWPLCHYFYAYTLYKNCFWQSYQQVNRLFCEEICRLIRPGDKVWIQDYQLMLLPGMLRKIYPELSIGYFHHIPFPSYELFRILPERAEILKGLLGADFIAFHTHDYMRHFISAVERVLHLDFKLDEVQINNRMVRVEALPMGINYESYHQASENKEVHQAIERTRKLFGEHKLILSVDRLDYSKGILHRLRGFATFLEHHAEYHGKVTLAMVIVPSRDHVDSYAELKTKIDEEIGSINGRYSTMNWTPVCYFYHGFSLEELTAMYYVADIALVTPLRDGMNLVAKEYVATKCDNPGVLILSEMAGAAVELTDAIQINPNDTEQIENAICQALEMPASIAQIKLKYNHAKQRLILLDYDGTLTALKPRPEDAQPTPELISILQQLASDPANHIVINSGRDHFTLEKWLGILPISMAAEHGAFYKENGVWHKNIKKIEWGAGILSILQMFVDRTPRSHLEVKETALAWHYRESDAWLGTLRAQQLVNTLISLCTRQKLQILQGNKVIEIKSPDCNKGSEVGRLLANRRYDFVIAMGDDTTDEDMFQALPMSAITIKIGSVSEAANYHLSAQSDVLPFLRSLLGKQKTATKEGSIKNRLTFAFDFLKDLLKTQ